MMAIIAIFFICSIAYVYRYPIMDMLFDDDLEE